MIVLVKTVHILLCWLLSACIFFTAYSAVADHVTDWTWAAIGLVIVEGFVLAAFGWRCPLTLLAEKLGASNGSVSRLFLPRWAARRLFPICGALFGGSVVLIVLRLVWG